MLSKSQLCWAEHVCRMGGAITNTRQPELSTGYSDRGALKKRLKDSLKTTLGTYHIDDPQWLILAADCHTWRCTVHQAISIFKDSHRANFKENHHRRKIQGAPAAIADQTFNCSHCSQTCLSRISLVSHQHTCSQSGQLPS